MKNTKQEYMKYIFLSVITGLALGGAFIGGFACGQRAAAQSVTEKAPENGTDQWVWYYIPIGE